MTLEQYAREMSIMLCRFLPGSGSEWFRKIGDDYQGMTLRDWFAGQALTGLCANEAVIGTLKTFQDETGKAPTTALANSALEFADAMLSARKEN